MGQCMSRKAAGAFAASAAATHNRPTKMHKHGELQSPGDDDKDLPKKSSMYTKGVATSFGFKRRPTTAPSIASNSNAARRLANTDIIDRNGNGHCDTEPLATNIAPTPRSTPKLMPPKKEGIATKVNRFGFRQPQVNRLSKVSDLNNPPIEVCNNNVARVKSNAANQAKGGRGLVGVTVDSNKNRMTKPAVNPPQAEKYMLQSTQLPRPEPIRVIETKTAKTLVNNSRRIAYHEDNSSKEGSLTEDSGVGSQVSAEMPGVERLNCSPTYGVRRGFYKTRNLEIVKSGNTFDVRDYDDPSESCAPLPQLPSAFSSNTEVPQRCFYNSGFVREKAREYQRYLDNDNRRKISVTSSEGFSDDYNEEEKTFRDKFRSEKTFIKSNAHRFLKKPESKDDSSPASSDEHEWGHGGEAMADEVSVSISSSDESKERDQPPVPSSLATITSTIQTLINTSLNSPKSDFKTMLLSIEDPTFAAVAASTNLTSLLDDETSPVDSLISCSETDEILKRKINRSSSNSKDINEKLTPPSPGTPTNVSNSLSLSDGKDDFLIDDEIADQPALVFEDTLVNNSNNDMTFSISQNNSESTRTIVDSSPKPKRRSFLVAEGSPLAIRKRKSLLSRTGSLDTLSPCESIASDDLMMDYDYSQSSGMEDDRIDRNESHNHGFSSLDETVIRKTETDDGLRDWSSLLGNYYAADKILKSNASKTTRLLWSRTGTPNSVPDSPKSVDSKSTAKSRHSVSNSPLRLSKAIPLSAGYDSDDSIRLDRANHSAMKQDIMSIKTMLIKLRRVLNESETHIPFDGQLALTNGLFNGLCSSGEDAQNDENADSRLELAELRRQVLFLQGQLEDKEKTVLDLQEQMVKITTENFTSNSAPASTVAAESTTCNAATQTERIRPISAGPSLLNGSPTDGNNAGSLVSANESPIQRRSRVCLQSDPPVKKPSAKLWRKPGEPPSPQRYTGHSSIPRRANSRTRTPSLPS